MDSICIRSIRQSIEWNYAGQEIVCSSIGFQSSGVNNSNFGAVKHSKIIKFILDAYILKYKNYGTEKLKDLPFGEPENKIFSEIVMDNKKLVYFNNEYFNHSQEYKTNFDINNIQLNNFDNKEMIVRLMEKYKHF